ncbi:hypothetical protein KAI78_05760 [bacterium]|nr:hypothetical protein [bacterium]
MKRFFLMAAFIAAIIVFPQGQYGFDVQIPAGCIEELVKYPGTCLRMKIHEKGVLQSDSVLFVQVAGKSRRLHLKNNYSIDLDVNRPAELIQWGFKKENYLIFPDRQKYFKASKGCAMPITILERKLYSFKAGSKKRGNRRIDGRLYHKYDLIDDTGSIYKDKKGRIGALILNKGDLSYKYEFYLQNDTLLMDLKYVEVEDYKQVLREEGELFNQNLITRGIILDEITSRNN